ncbi:MAG: hypothetical protein M1820_004433 [Bogoriella megaspora]|nr:MAG: hypothetical protein M1820_004433 [Bogoriella megaspora]
MRITMRQSVLAVSTIVRLQQAFIRILQLTLPTLAGYAMHVTNSHSLPIPITLTAFALVLPPVCGLFIEAATSLTRKGAPRRDALTLTSTSSTSSLPLILTLGALLVYESVVATLAGSYLAPVDRLTCGLQERWQSLWINKDEEAIQAIQSGLLCCGLRSTRDMAWPFEHGKSAAFPQGRCVEMTGRTDRCLDLWRGEQQKVAGMLLVVAVGVFLWKAIIISIPTGSPSWFARLFDENGQPLERRALEYQPNPEIDEQPYSDTPPSAEEIQREIRHGTRKAIEDVREVRKKKKENLRRAKSTPAGQPSGLITDGNEWSRDGDEEIIR